MSTKVLLIGLDSADPHLLSTWAAAGDLPALRSLSAAGGSGILKNEAYVADQGAWAGLVTAVGPAKHGFTHHRQMFPGSYETRSVRSDDLRAVPFWMQLSAQGRRVALIDTPRAPVATDLNGILLADWIVHPRLYRQTVSYPAELSAEIQATYGTDSTAAACEHRTEPLDLPTFVAGLEAGIRSKVRMVCDLLGREAWDLFAVTFKEAHCIGHHFWHVHDSGHPSHDPHVRQTFGDPLAQVYRATDDAIAAILERVSAETTVMVFTTLGMGPNYTGNHLLDAVLLRLEEKPGTTSALRSVWRRVGYRARVRLWSRLRPFAQRLRDSSLGGRSAFAVEYNEMAGAVVVNRRGRFPSGCVEPGAASDELCDFLQEELSRLVDADDGTPIVDHVVRTKDFTDGPHRDVLPDLLVVWRRDRPIASAASPRIGVVRGAYATRRSGSHTPDGMLLARRLGIAPGTPISGAQLMDIGPTVGALLGCQLDGLEGRPITALA
ncbi:MAG: alkaline phosphatase family protein [Deltaproteobacteria bacterium]|nr:alkaline phosphatase family protein [Deltaproteobacteria bacterium]